MYFIVNNFIGLGNQKMFNTSCSVGVKFITAYGVQDDNKYFPVPCWESLFIRRYSSLVCFYFRAVSVIFWT